MARIDLPKSGLGVGGLSYLALRDQGVPSATPAYYQESGEAGQNINSSNDWQAQMIIPDCDFKLTSISIRTQNETIEGTRTIELYSHNPSTGKPNASLKILGTLGSGGGGATPEWNRLAISSSNQYQLYHGKIYWVVSKGEDSKDWDESIRRWNTAQGSMFPDNMPKCMYSTDGGSNWSECTQDGKPALWNIIINSLNSHIPQFCYGRKYGKYIVMPSDIEVISESAHFLDCSGLTADTFYYVYMDSSGTLKASTDDYVYINGLPVHDGAPTEKLVGLIYPINFFGGAYQGPVDCMDRRFVAYPGMKKTFGKFNPYSANTTENFASSTAWRQIMNNTDWKIEGLVSGFSLIFSTTCQTTGEKYIGIGVNATTPSEKSSTAVLYPAYAESTAICRDVLSGVPSYNYFYPVCRTDSSSQIFDHRQTDKRRAGFLGEIWWK